MDTWGWVVWSVVWRLPVDIATWVGYLVGVVLTSLLISRSQMKAMGPELRALSKERSLRRRYYIGRAVGRGEKLEDPGDAAFAASLARYQQAVLRSWWWKLSAALGLVYFGGLGILLAVADGPAWLVAVTAGAFLLVGRQVLFRQRMLSRLEGAERANRGPSS